MILGKRSSGQPARTTYKRSPKGYLKPLLLFFSKHIFFYHPCLDRYTGKAFEPEPDIAAELALGL